MRDPTIDEILKDEACFEIIRKKLRQDCMDHFSVIAYEMVPMDKVNGFQGQYFTLKATVACPETPLDKRIINFFAKIKPRSCNPLSGTVEEFGTFKKEVDIYTTVFPEMLNGLDARCIPECFSGVDNDVIVLEDMAHSGFMMSDKRMPFDLEHCLVLLRTLAKFHAKSLILEERWKRNLSEEFSHCMHETLFPDKDGRSRGLFDAAVKGIMSLIDLVPQLDRKQRQAFKEKLVELCADHAQRLSPSVKFRNVLCHGDLWANNVLFKYDANRKPTECCLIDFQLARYNPPAHDVLCFLQFTTTRKTRDDHASTLFRSYHETLTDSLKEANLDATKVFPWEIFTASIEELRVMCMVHGILNIPIMLLESEAVNKYFMVEPELLESVLFVDRTPLVCSQFHEVPKYRNRMLDALLELYDAVAG